MDPDVNIESTYDSSSVFFCRVCSHGPLGASKYLFGHKSKKYIPLYKCNHCFSLFTNPREYTNRSENKFQWQGGIDYFLQRKDKTMRTVTRILNTLIGSNGGCGKKFLDIGCAIGISLIAAQQFGFEAHGVEPEIHIAQYAKNELKLNVRNALFDRNLFESNSFDFIMMNQVLEHVLNPKVFLADTITLLKPGGILFLSVPPADWLRLKLSNLTISKIRKLDLFYDPDEHVNYFFQKGIKLLVQGSTATFDGIYHPSKTRLFFYRIMHLTSGSYVIRKPYSI